MEQKRIKGKQTSYYKKSENKEIVRISKYINLGVNSAFDVDDTVIVLSAPEYDDLLSLANTDTAKAIAKNDETISELNNIVAKVTEDNNRLEFANMELLNTITDNETKLSELQAMVTELQVKLSKYDAIDVEHLQDMVNSLESNNTDLLNKVTNRDEYIIYLELLQTEYKLLLQYLNSYLKLYKQRGLINRIANKDVTDIDKPQLEMIDFKGNVSDDAKAPIITVNPDNVTKS